MPASQPKCVTPSLRRFELRPSYLNSLKLSANPDEWPLLERWEYRKLNGI
jgi:hypothetical protein